MAHEPDPVVASEPVSVVGIVVTVVTLVLPVVGSVELALGSVVPTVVASSPGGPR
jgi:hypothetical protein